MKYFIFVLSFVLFVSNVNFAYAEKDSSVSAKKELRKEVLNLKKEVKNKPVNLIGATMTGINSNVLTVTKDGKTYTVTTDANTKFRRHFWGKSSLTEIKVNDKLNIWGTWTDDTQTSIRAKLIRDLSVQKRQGVFLGKIISLGTNSFVFQTNNRGDLTVTVSQNTKYSKRNDKTISFADLKVNDKVRVKGLWDKQANTITDVTEIKNYTLPL